LLYNQKAWSQLKWICEIISSDKLMLIMTQYNLMDEFWTTEIKSELVNSLLRTVYDSELVDKLTNQYIDQYHETSKYSSIDLLISKDYGYQVRFETKLFGLSVPVLGFADYVSHEHGIDLKTVDKLPDTIPLGDKIQIYIYEQVFKTNFELIYVSPPANSELDKFYKNEAIINLHEKGISIPEIVKSLSTTKPYVEKTIQSGMPTKPELQYLSYSLTGDDRSMLDWFVPKLAHKTLRVMGSREYIDDLMLTDLSGWSLSDSEKEFIFNYLKENK
jgi:hypothetical protein